MRYFRDINLMSSKKYILILFFTTLISFSQNSEDKTLALKVHNDARLEVGVNPLVWSNKLEKEALNYAKQLARRNSFKHSKRTRNGENLAKFYEHIYSAGTKTNVYSSTPLYDSSIEWYNEIDNYRRSKIRKFRIGPKVGHYTQMVWKDTKRVGIASAVSKNGTVYIVARYYPAGNYLGEYPY